MQTRKIHAKLGALKIGQRFALPEQASCVRLLKERRTHTQILYKLKIKKGELTESSWVGAYHPPAAISTVTTRFHQSCLRPFRRGTKISTHDNALCGYRGFVVR